MAGIGPEPDEDVSETEPLDSQLTAIRQQRASEWATQRPNPIHEDIAAAEWTEEGTQEEIVPEQDQLPIPRSLSGRWRCSCGEEMPAEATTCTSCGAAPGRRAEVGLSEARCIGNAAKSSLGVIVAHTCVRIVHFVIAICLLSVSIEKLRVLSSTADVWLICTVAFSALALLGHACALTGTGLLVKSLPPQVRRLMAVTQDAVPVDPDVEAQRDATVTQAINGGVITCCSTCIGGSFGLPLFVCEIATFVLHDIYVQVAFGQLYFYTTIAVMIADGAIYTIFFSSMTFLSNSFTTHMNTQNRVRVNERQDRVPSTNWGRIVRALARRID